MRVCVIAIIALFSGCVASPWQESTATHVVYRGQDSSDSTDEGQGVPPFVLENEFVSPEVNASAAKTHRPTIAELDHARQKSSQAIAPSSAANTQPFPGSVSSRVARADWLASHSRAGGSSALLNELFATPISHQAALASGTTTEPIATPTIAQPESLQSTTIVAPGYPTLVHGNSRWPRTWVIEDVFKNRVLKKFHDPEPSSLDQRFYKPIWKFTGDLYQDNRYFYDRQSLTYLGLALGGAAILANTDADENFQDWFLQNATFDPSDYSIGNLFGDIWVMPGLIAITWGVTEGVKKWTDYGYSPVNLTLQQWSQQSLRGLIVSAVPVFSLQWILGASRPGEDPTKGSRWKPFDDNNSVSGHAAVGAVPFLVAAKMSDSIVLKSLFFLGSGISGYSRLREDRHYLSQVLLGWTIAYLAVEATELTEHSSTVMRIVPVDLPGVYGIGLESRF